MACCVIELLVAAVRDKGWFVEQDRTIIYPRNYKLTQTTCIPPATILIKFTRLRAVGVKTVKNVFRLPVLLFLLFKPVAFLNKSNLYVGWL